ncbi:MAG: hypothetical protein WCF14_02075, partial [Nitrososphaeraceae archaeon]
EQILYPAVDLRGYEVHGLAQIFIRIHTSSIPYKTWNNNLLCKQFELLCYRGLAHLISHRSHVLSTSSEELPNNRCLLVHNVQADSLFGHTS